MKVTYGCLLTTILLLPWYIVRWQMAGIPTTLLEVSVIITLVVWTTERWRWRSAINVRSIVDAYRGWLVWAGLFLVASIVAVIVSPDHRQALGLFKSYIIEPIVIAIVTIDVIGRDRPRWWGIIVALLVCGMEVVMVSFSQFIFGWPNLAPAELIQGRISSFYASANWVALILGPLVAMGAALLLGGIKGRGRAISLGCVVLAMVLAMVLCRSRGGFMGLLAVLIGLGMFWCVLNYCQSILQARVWWRIGLAVFLAVYVASCVGFVWIFNHPPMVANPYSRPGFTTFTVRQCLWQGTKNMLDQRPLAGAGLAGFTQEYLEHVTCDAEPLKDPHMLVLNFWSETGLLGLLAIIGLMGYWLWQSYDIVAVSDHPWVGVGLLLALVYCLVHGLVDVPYFKNDLSMEWWLLVGLIIASRRVWLASLLD